MDSEKVSANTMDSEKVFHMAGGVGETSYAKNSLIQKKASDKAKNITLQTIQQVYNLHTTTSKSFGIADLGCGSGHNTLSIIKQMLEACSYDEYDDNINNEFRVYLNDLPNNDFNAIFKALPDFYTELRRDGKEKFDHIYIGAYPGSFYGRLFPEKCLHFIYSNNSLHWLSKVPPSIYDKQNNSMNKGNIYISESSPLEVSQAYFRQFQEDLWLFLRSRSEELVAGGRMVLIVSGRSGRNHDDRGITFLWTLLSKSLAILVSQGLVEEEKLDGYNVQFYAPSEDEINDEVIREGSFQMDRFEMFEIDKVVDGGASYGTAVAMTAKAVQGPMICQHFGDGVLDSVFENYGRLVDEEMAIEEIRPIYFVFVLRKL